MFIVNVNCGRTGYSKLFDDAASGKDWLDIRAKNLADAGWDVMVPADVPHGQSGFRLTKGDIVIDATGAAADASTLKSVVKAPDWVIKLMLELSPN